jgi:hypothetical protein
MKRAAVFAIALLILDSCRIREEPSPAEQPQAQDQVEVFLDVTAIAGESPDQVAQVLGTPTSTKETTVAGRDYPRHFYRGGEVEVIFVLDKAAWITIHPAEKLPFQKTALAALGLPVADPSLTHPLSLMRWKDYQELKEINFFANADRTIRYISVCVINCP